MTPRNILVINCGSSSLKFALVNPKQSEFAISGLAERLNTPEAIVTWKTGSDKNSLMIPNGDHKTALSQIMPRVQEVCQGELDGIGHRVVHGGRHFTAPHRITPQVLSEIERISPLAPLHNPPALQGMRAALEVYPDLLQVVVFDTAFHQTMPEHAFRYCIPEEYYAKHNIRRYGFHGTSHRYVSQQAADFCNLNAGDSYWLSAHLGNGCSTCAIANGQSLDTSMGLTPQEGVCMGTRSGDVDPGLHGHLVRILNMSVDEVDNLLTKQSGLLGLSGLSNDMRSLEEARSRGHKGATLAIEVFCYRLAKSLASMACALPRIDGLIFTGGIGENSPLIRARTVSWLKLLGFEIESEANAKFVRGKAGLISKPNTPRIIVMPTNEERQIALDTLLFVEDK